MNLVRINREKPSDGYLQGYYGKRVDLHGTIYEALNEISPDAFKSIYPFLNHEELLATLLGLQRIRSARFSLIKELAESKNIYQIFNTSFAVKYPLRISNGNKININPFQFLNMHGNWVGRRTDKLKLEHSRLNPFTKHDSLEERLSNINKDEVQNFKESLVKPLKRHLAEYDSYNTRTDISDLEKDVMTFQYFKMKEQPNYKIADAYAKQVRLMLEVLPEYYYGTVNVGHGQLAFDL